MTCCGSTLNYFDSPNHCWTEEEIEEQLSSPKSTVAATSANARKKRSLKKANSTAAAANAGSGDGGINIHPWDSTINLSVHMPLYPPGRIIHLVRQYPKVER